MLYQLSYTRVETILAWTQKGRPAGDPSDLVVRPPA
jgi:hypothetical protein